MKLRDLAEIVDGKILGDPDIEITGATGIAEAKKGDITFFADKKMMPLVSGTDASAIIVNEEIKGLSTSMLMVNNAYLAFAKILEALYGKSFEPTGISDKAIIGVNVKFGEGVSVYPLAYVCDNVHIGSQVTLSPNIYIGEGVTVGNNSVIYPNVTIRAGTKIGERVIIHPGTVIGSDGFGYILEEGTHYKIPQVGGVIIEDDVEIGANVTIDRATTGNTVIGRGTKIDNLVQIAHNVKIGKHYQGSQMIYLMAV
jgi:UDP-3-O-[3-hydroxymyristoyl] glucosamine N-acyltransferase